MNGVAAEQVVILVAGLVDLVLAAVMWRFLAPANLGETEPNEDRGRKTSATDGTVPCMDSDIANTDIDNSDIDMGAIPAEPPVAGNELDTLLGELERVRGYIAWKCGGLDSAGLRATLRPSTMTLGGLLKHLSVCEDHTFSVKLYGRVPHPPWDTVDWDADPDWEWHSAAADSPEQLMSLWRDTVNRSRDLVAKALADGGLEHVAASGWPDGRAPNLRRLLIDMIEEYARHVGHADLIRESVDGLVGEDPPGDNH